MTFPTGTVLTWHCNFRWQYIYLPVNLFTHTHHAHLMQICVAVYTENYILDRIYILEKNISVRNTEKCIDIMTTYIHVFDDADAASEFFFELLLCVSLFCLVTTKTEPCAQNQNPSFFLR